MSRRIITIDGPAGAGKTTVSKVLACRLGCVYVDTGALYRGVAYEIDRQRLDWRDEKVLERFLSALDLNLSMADDALVLSASGRDITPFLRTQEISMLASATSAIPAVRQALLGIQKNIAARCDAVFEGRDMGTAVFPGAAFKFFLTADLSVRAKRRFDETAGPDRDMEMLTAQMAKRDKDDAEREVSPLKPAEDAFYIDATELTVDQVVEKMMGIIETNG